MRNANILGAALGVLLSRPATGALPPPEHAHMLGKTASDIDEAIVTSEVTQDVKIDGSWIGRTAAEVAQATGEDLQFKELRTCCGTLYGYADQFGRKYDLDMHLTEA